MIQIRRIWRHAGEHDSIHLILSSDTATGEDVRPERHIKLKRSSNPAMYDFISENASTIPTDNRTDTDLETSLEQTFSHLVAYGSTT